MTDRVDCIAQDLYDFGGRLYTKTKLAEFLGTSREKARDLLVGYKPCIGRGTGAKYYFRDVAEAIAKGR